jgi:tRNA-dihydrouridine synthase
MNFYFAPLEGLTGYVYRNAHNTFLKDDIDKYFSPFIAANLSESFKAKELNDILPENNQGQVLVPQILTNRANHFVHTAKKLNVLGYNEVNLNLGCPAGTVVAKSRGSGFLAKQEELDTFLDEIYSNSVTEISIKTRIGKDQPEEFYELIEIFNKYPIKELIIHPRTQKDFYKNKPNLDVFRDAITLSKNPVCYNGDICTIEDYHTFVTAFPSVDKIMIGRGLLKNPALVGTITKDNKLDIEMLKEFHDQVYEGYKKVLYGEKNVLYKMKELWFYMITNFSDYEKYAKKIKKSEKLLDYDIAVASLFREQHLLSE